MKLLIRKMISLNLAALMCLSVFALVSCSESGVSGEPGETSAQSVPGPSGDPAADAGEEEGTPADEADPGLLDELPTDQDLGGEDYIVLSHDHGAASVAWMVQDIWTEGETGERINDAVFQRNLLMEDRFNVKVKQRLESDPQAIMRTAVTSGETFLSVSAPFICLCAAMISRMPAGSQPQA